MHIAHVVDGVHKHVRTNAHAYMPLFRVSETAGRIELKFGVWLQTAVRARLELGILQKSKVGYICGCARADVSPYLRNGRTHCAEIWCVGRDPIAGCFTKVWGGVQSTCARAHPFSVSRERLNGLREIWCVVRGPLDMHYEWSALHVRKCVHLLYISVNAKHCYEIWCVVTNTPISYAFCIGH